MRGNTFGKLFSVTSFGESHGEALGCVIDGVPAGLDVDLQSLIKELERRRPGRLKVSTSRDEKDLPEVLSGVFEGKTLGTPIAVIIRNTNQKSSDYSKDMKRPGHGDITYDQKFGHRDYRGGGRASGRETATRVIAGHFAGLILPEVKLKALIEVLGSFNAKCDDPFGMDFGELGFADPSLEPKIEKTLLNLKENGESAGGSVRVVIRGVESGLGEPVFDKLKADFAKAMLSIGSSVGIEFGLGKEFTTKGGKETTSAKENFGGIEAGISNGDEISFLVHFRAPSTVGEKAKEGRHDPCILPRALPVIESMAKIVLADHKLRQRAYQL